MDGAVVLVRPGLEVDVDDFEWRPQVLIHHEFIEVDVPGQLSTEQTGRIEIITDGKQMWMMGER